MRIAISVLSKGKFAISQVKKVKLLFLTNLRFCLLLLIKQNCLQKTFLKTQNLKAQVSLYLSSWDNVKLYSVHVTPKLLKKITNLDLSKTCSWLFSCGSEEVWARTFIHTSWTRQFVSEGIFISRLLEGARLWLESDLQTGPCI